MSTASQVLEVDLNKTVLSSKDLKNLVSTKSHDRILDASNGFMRRMNPYTMKSPAKMWTILWSLLAAEKLFLEL